jgi:hypothetical protein
MPTRVLDIGLADKPNLHLHITNSKSPSRPYATLSHYWGKIQIEQLRTDNFDRMCNGIDPSTLTKTFQDAIYITHRLGIRFLWIDSLCIIQDSVSDWAKESSTMGEVYANGIFKYRCNGGFWWPIWVPLRSKSAVSTEMPSSYWGRDSWVYRSMVLVQ